MIIKDIITRKKIKIAPVKCLGVSRALHGVL